MATGTHDHPADPRNDEILIWVNGELSRAREAVVSVFDSGFVLGDGVWEGIRVSGGHPVFLERHLDRLWEGSKAIMLDVGMSRDALTAAIYDTIRGNEMTDGVHIRLMVTRGVKSTPYQDPRMTDRPGHRGDHRRAQGADALHRHRRHHALHDPRTPRDARTPSTPSSTRTPSSTTSRRASRPTRPAPTRR